MNTIHTILGLSLAATLFLEVPRGLGAEPSKAVPESMVGRIVAFNKASHALTVDIQGSSFQFDLHPQVLVLLKDQKATVDALEPGKVVSLALGVGESRGFEITSVKIESGGAPAQAVQVPAQAVQAAAPETTAVASAVSALEQKAPKLTKHEISISGDFMLGKGDVSLPIGFSLRETLGGIASLDGEATIAYRESQYYGITLSYSYGQKWYFDISYAHGESSGNQAIDTGWLGNLNSQFSISDDWYQAYVRYTFPKLRGRRLSAYLRAGVSYVQADISINAVSPASGRYSQTDKTSDFLGNLGFGLGYALTPPRRMRLSLQLEGEAFAGFRTQESLEILSAVEGLEFKPATLDNMLFGGIGRATVRLEWRLGRSGLFKAFLDGGGQMRYTIVSYPSPTRTFQEFLWGPYVKAGVRYAF